MTEATASTIPSLLPWLPQEDIKEMSSREALLSKGFLRAQPEKWFPGLASRWLSLSHLCLSDFRLVGVQPTLEVPPSSLTSFFGTVDGEAITLSLDPDTVQIILDVLVPEARSPARKVTLEYVARRLFSSLAESWSGPVTSIFRFSPTPPSSFDGFASIRLQFSLNGRPGSWWITLGSHTVTTLDGLWRRQVQSTSKGPQEGGRVHFEIAQLAVPPTLLEEYLQSGTVIDLETRLTDKITLRVGPRPWAMARLVTVENTWAFEILPGAPAVTHPPAGTTRLSIEFEPLSLRGSALAELSQSGAVLTTDRPVNDRVLLAIDNQVIKGAVLQSYEGRFAITVD
jgi:flagellar motor switch/type III secretory pathway protein FliN